MINQKRKGEKETKFWVYTMLPAPPPPLFFLNLLFMLPPETTNHFLASERDNS